MSGPWPCGVADQSMPAKASAPRPGAARCCRATLYVAACPEGGSRLISWKNCAQVVPRDRGEVTCANSMLGNPEMSESLAPSRSSSSFLTTAFCRTVRRSAFEMSTS